MKILISTGIYPPKTSGPAQYAQNMMLYWSKMGHKVIVSTYGVENLLPTGIRHFYYFLRVFPKVMVSDRVFILDTFSVGFPTVLACKILGKKCVIRTGGDFLWEGYVERTGDEVLLRDFYQTKLNNLNFKERVIFSLTKWTIKNTSLLVFSTEWQRKIFAEPYKLDLNKTIVVENHFNKINIGEGEFQNSFLKVFVGGVRKLKWKNTDLLKKVFQSKRVSNSGAVLDMENMERDSFLQKILNSYAVILVSLGDISPHMIIDAMSLNKPFIITKENGLMDRIASVAITVDPNNEEDIADKVLWLLNEDNYKSQVEKIKNFSFVRTWEDIASEYMKIFEKI